MKEQIAINRNAVLIIPKKAYYDWANSIFPEDPIEEDDFYDYNTYLINENSLLEGPEEALSNYWKDIFEDELFEISTEDEDWPKDLTWELFNEFFTCYFSSLVVDLEENRFYLDN